MPNQTYARFVEKRIASCGSAGQLGAKTLIAAGDQSPDAPPQRPGHAAPANQAEGRDSSQSVDRSAPWLTFPGGADVLFSSGVWRGAADSNGATLRHSIARHAARASSCTACAGSGAGQGQEARPGRRAKVKNDR